MSAPQKILGVEETVLPIGGHQASMVHPKNAATLTLRNGKPFEVNSVTWIVRDGDNLFVRVPNDGVGNCFDYAVAQEATCDVNAKPFENNAVRSAVLQQLSQVPDLLSTLKLRRDDSETPKLTSPMDYYRYLEKPSTYFHDIDIIAHAAAVGREVRVYMLNQTRDGISTVQRYVPNAVKGEPFCLLNSGQGHFEALLPLAKMSGDSVSVLLGPAKSSLATRLMRDRSADFEYNLSDLRLFKDTMNNWTRQGQDAVTASLNASKALRLVAMKNPGKFETNSKYVIFIGDQSSGKTTTGIEFTGMVAFLVDPETGTRALTITDVQFDPSMSPHDEPRGSMEYVTRDGRVIKEEDLSLDALLDLHLRTFAGQPIDDKNTCSIRLRTGNLTLCIPFVDVPGFVLSFAEQTKSIAAKVLTERFHGKHQEGLVVVCLAADKKVSEIGIPNLAKQLRNVNPENVVLSFNRMDRLNPGDAAEWLRQYAEALSLKKDSAREGFIVASPLDILRALEYHFKSLKESDSDLAVLPQGAKSFFCTSSKEKIETLKSIRDHNERWRCFRKSADETSRAFDHLIKDSATWEQHRVTLRTMSDTEKAQFAACVGVPSFKTFVLEEQRKQTIQLIDEILAPVRRVIEVCTLDVRHANEARRAGVSYGQGIYEFLEEIPRWFHIVGQQQPVVSDRAEDQKLWTLWKQIAQAKTAGWSIADMLRILGDFKKPGAFPPPHYRATDYADLMKKIGEYVSPSDLAEVSLPKLLRRVEMLVAVLSQMQFKSGPGIQQLTPNEALSDFVAGEILKCFSEEGSTNTMISNLVALCVLMQAQTVAYMVSSQSRFVHLLGDEQRGFDPQKLTCPINLLDNITVFAASQTDGDQHLVDQLHAVNDDPDDPTAEPKLADFLQLASKELAKEENLNAVYTPRDDLIYVIIATFFDGPRKEVDERLRQNTTALQQTQGPFVATALSMAPLFQHHDPKYLADWGRHHPQHAFAVRFLQAASAERGTERMLNRMKTLLTNEVTDIIVPSGVGKVLRFVLNGSGLVDAVRPKIEAILGKGAKPGAVEDHALEYELSSPVQSFFNFYGVPDEPASPLSSSEPELFKDPAYTEAFARIVLHVQRMGAKDRARLMSDIVRGQITPDFMEQLEQGGSFTDHEWEAVKYVHDRYTSTSAFLHLMSSLLVITSSAYPFSHFGFERSHRRELIERFVSILLGYPYPLKATERTKDPKLAFLDPRRVIDFLNRYRTCWFDDEKLKTTTYVEADRKFLHSPLAQYILERVNLARAAIAEAKKLDDSNKKGQDAKNAEGKKDRFSSVNGHEQQKEIEAKIVEIYKASLITGEAGEDRFEAVLLLALSDYRYSSAGLNAKLQRLCEEANAELSSWREVANQLDGYKKFLEEHGAKLVMQPDGSSPAAVRNLRPTVNVVMPTENLMPEAGKQIRSPQKKAKQ